VAKRSGLASSLMPTTLSSSAVAEALHSHSTILDVAEGDPEYGPEYTPEALRREAAECRRLHSLVDGADEIIIYPNTEGRPDVEA
jgi:hypothetical protein